MLRFIKTDASNQAFKELSGLFDAFLVDIDGDQFDFYSNLNNVFLEHVLVFYENEIAVGCGGFKINDSNLPELKRMFVHPEYRKKGISNILLTELELWIKELNFKEIVLETSPKLETAIALYKKFGYVQIPNYGIYIGEENSICMKKTIK